MSFPLPAPVTQTAFGADTTAHAANMGTTANGDRLIALFTNDGDATVTTPGGWNLLDSTPNGTAVRASWYYRDTDGSDSGGTVDFVTSAAEHATAQIWRLFAGTFDTGTAPQIATAATGSSTTPDPPSLSPSWGAGVDTTYITGFGKDDDDGAFRAEQYPSNFYGGSWLRSTSGSITCSQASCFALDDTGTKNPTAFSGIASQEWVANTVAIKGIAPHSDPYPTNLTTNWSETDATSYATASITPPASTPILATVWSRFAGGTPNQPTASGNGITWSVVASVVNGEDRVTLFEGSNASPSSGAVTFDFGGQTQTRAVWNVHYWTYLASSPVVQFQTATGTGTSPTADFTSAFADATNVSLSISGLAANTITVTPDAGFFGIQHSAGTGAGSVELEFKPSEEQTPAPTYGSSVAWEQIIVELSRDSAGPQDLTGTLFTNAPIFPQGVITQVGGPSTLDGSLFASSPSFPQGAITTGAVTLSGVLFTNAPDFPTGEVLTESELVLDGLLFQSAPLFPVGSIAESDQTLSGETFVSEAAFFTGLLAGPEDFPTAAPSAATTTDEGLRFEVWSLPQLGTFSRKYDLTRWVNAFTVSDKYGEISDGKLTIADSLPTEKLDQLIKVDRANHANDEGSVIRVLRGTTPIIHYVTKQYDDSWSSDDPTASLSLEGMELLLDRAIVPRHDYPALPSVEPDWVYGALSILGNTDLDVSASTSEVATLEINATGGTFTIGIDYPVGTGYVHTANIPFNATAQNVADAIEATGVLDDVLVSGGGTPENPFLIELLDPAGEDVGWVTDSGLLSGLASVGTLTPGGNLATDPWTRSLNPTSGVFHGSYTTFEISTEQFRSAPFSLKIDGDPPATPGAFPGAQQLISVTPGRTYRAAVWVYPTNQAAFRFVIRTRDETYIASESTVLTANSWQEIRIPVVTIPDHVNQIIFRIATISDVDQPAWYVDDALFAPGGEAATYGAIISDILAPIQSNGVLTWLIPTWSDTHDSSGTPWDRELEWSVKRGQTMLQLVEHGRKWNYESRIRWDNAASQFKWDLFNPNTGGIDHTGSGLAITGRGISSSGTIARRFPEASYYQAEGDGGQWGEHSDATLEGAWGRLEQYLANNQAIDADSLEDMAERLVNESRDRTDGLSVRLQVPTALPWAKFSPGDKLKVNLEPQREAEVLRCMAVVASMGPNDAVPAYDVHFGSIVYRGEAATLQAVRVLWRERKGLQTAPAVSQNPGIVAVGTGTFSVFSLPGQAFVEVGRLKLLFPLPVTVIGVSIACGPIAPTGSSLIVDVNKNGVSIFTAGARPTIPAGSFTSTEAIPSTTAVGAGEYLTVDVDQVGSTLPGGDLTVMVRWIWSVTTV